MKLRDEHPIRLAFIGLVIAITYVGILIPSGFLEGARLKSHDAYCRFRNLLVKPPAELNQITLVTVDEESQRQLGRKWPWDRSLFAEFLTRLSQHQPRVIVLDFAFSGASDLIHDQALAQAIQKAPPTLLAAYLDRHGDLVFPLPLFTESGALTGLINKPRDPDHSVRRLWASLRVPLAQEPLYAIEVKAAALADKIPFDQIQTGRQLSLGSLQVPLEPPGALRINYLASSSQIPTVAFWKVVRGEAPPETFRDKVVLVGSASEITHDIYPTSLGLMPGVAISVNGILTILSRQFIRPLPLWANLLVSCLGVILILLWTYRNSFWLGAIGSLMGVGVAAATGLLLLVGTGLQTESIGIVILGAVSWLVGALYKYLLLVRAALALHRQVITDPITGLFTSRYFKLRLDALWEKTHKGRGALSMLVVQTTPLSQRVQTGTWEEAKRQILQWVPALQGMAPHGGLAGTLSDGTFAILLPGVKPSKAKGLAQTSLETLRAQGPEKFSMGLACAPNPSILSAAHLLQAAQLAAARAWTQAAPTLCEFDPALDVIQRAEEKTPQGERPTELSFVASELEERNQALEKALSNLRQAHQQLEAAFLEVTKSLVMAMETKDAYTAGHLERVSRYATCLAQAVQLPKEEVESIREAALLHDIGKIGLPDEVLHKIGKLTEEEKKIIQQHLSIGAKILEPMKFFKSITTLIYHHHEWYNGQGYPHGLAGNFIPAGAQIIAIADSFDAMTTHRGYNKPLSPQEAVEELKKGANTQFNPLYVEKFTQVIATEGPQLAGYTA